MQSSYLKNIITILTGSSIAQAIPILITPLLARIYAPEDFGAYALYLGLVSILVVLATGKYENAILLSKTEKEANNVCFLTLLLCFVFCAFLFLIVIFFKNIFAALLSWGEISNVFYFLPVSVLIMSIFNVMTFWLSRTLKYKSISLNRIFQNGGVALAQVVVGKLKLFSFGMIFADFFGRLISVIIIFLNFLKNVDLKFDFREKKQILSRYKKFPLHEAPAELFNIASLQIPFLLIPVYFSAHSSGLYFLVFRVVMAPVSLIGSSIGEVFRVKAARELQVSGGCQALLLKTMLSLVLMSIVPSFILIIYGMELFVFFFGEEWASAGRYAEILAPLALLRLISAPLSYMFILREKLSLDMLLQGSFFTITLISIVLVGVYGDIHDLVVMISISGCAFYIVQLIFSYNLSKKKLVD